MHRHHEQYVREGNVAIPWPARSTARRSRLLEDAHSTTDTCIHGTKIPASDQIEAADDERLPADMALQPIEGLMQAVSLHTSKLATSTACDSLDQEDQDQDHGGAPLPSCLTRTSGSSPNAVSQIGPNDHWYVGGTIDRSHERGHSTRHHVDSDDESIIFIKEQPVQVPRTDYEADAAETPLCNIPRQISYALRLVPRFEMTDNEKRYYNNMVHAIYTRYSQTAPSLSTVLNESICTSGHPLAVELTTAVNEIMQTINLKGIQTVFLPLRRIYLRFAFLQICNATSRENNRYDSKTHVESMTAALQPWTTYSLGMEKLIIDMYTRLQRALRNAPIEFELEATRRLFYTTHEVRLWLRRYVVRHIDMLKDQYLEGPDGVVALYTRFTETTVSLTATLQRCDPRAVPVLLRVSDYQPTFHCTEFKMGSKSFESAVPMPSAKLYLPLQPLLPTEDVVTILEESWIPFDIIERMVTAGGPPANFDQSSNLYESSRRT